MLAQEKTCSPRCESFKCAKDAIVYRQEGIWCRWTEEMCNVSNCTYGLCVRRRLLPRGICGETIKRKTVERQPEEIVHPAVKLRGRILRKIGDKEVY